MYFRAFLVLLIAGLGVLSIASTRDNEFIKHDDFIESALQKYLETQPSNVVIIGPNGVSKNVDVLQFQSQEELHKLFPDCCRFFEHDPESVGPTAFQRLRLGFAGYVTIRAELKFTRVTSDGQAGIKFYKTYWMNKSGAVIQGYPKDPRF